MKYLKFFALVLGVVVLGGLSVDSCVACDGCQEKEKSVVEQESRAVKETESAESKSVEEKQEVLVAKNETKSVEPVTEEPKEDIAKIDFEEYEKFAKIVRETEIDSEVESTHVSANGKLA